MYTTRSTLLKKLFNNDEIGWEEFFDSYKELLYSVVMQNNIDPSDADDVVQQTMLAVFNGGAFAYDKSKNGTFRSWLGGIVRHKVVDHLRKRKPTEVLNEEIADSAPVADQMFLKEYRKHILTLAINEMRSQVTPEAFEAFQLCVLRNMSDNDAAELLGAKPNTVTIRKRRCMETLRKIIARLNREDPELELVWP